MKCDNVVAFDISERPNSIIPWLLICSYCYYIKDESIVEDTLYDSMCKKLLSEWDSLSHKWKSLITKGDMSAGSMFAMKEDHYPRAVVAMSLAILNGRYDDVFKTRHNVPA